MWTEINASLVTGNDLQKKILVLAHKLHTSQSPIYDDVKQHEGKFVRSLDTTSVIIQGPRLFRSAMVRDPLLGNPAGGAQSPDCVTYNMNHCS